MMMIFPNEPDRLETSLNGLYVVRPERNIIVVLFSDLAPGHNQEISYCFCNTSFIPITKEIWIPG